MKLARGKTSWSWNRKGHRLNPCHGGGKVESIKVKVGDKITPGTVILTVSGGGGSAPSTAPAPKARPAPVAKTEAVEEPEAEEAAETAQEEPMPVVESTGESFAPPASPTIRKLARELGIDLRRVKGSQHGGRIVMEDLRRYIQGLIRQAEKARGAARPAPAGTAPTPVDFAQWGPVSRVPFSPLRQVIARRMVESVTTLPQVTQFDEADITHLMALRSNGRRPTRPKGRG